MKTVNVHSIEIQADPYSPAPVLTAVHHLREWLRQKTGVEISVGPIINPGDGRFPIIVGVLEQPEIRDLVKEYELPATVCSDGYVLAQQDGCLLIYSQAPRGVVYACGYELPRRAIFHGPYIDLDFNQIIEEPTDDLRGWCSWGRDYSFIPHAVMKYRLNMAWMECNATGEALLPGDPGLQPYIITKKEEITQNRIATDKAIALAKSYGVEAFIGSLNAFWALPDYLFEGFIQAYPETIATSYRGGSEWPPYEWQDRPQLCPSNSTTRRLYASIVEEFLTAHSQADGIVLGVGYDGYPLGCGCKKCQDYTYADRFRDQIMLVYDIAVQKYGKKLWIWTWVVGGASSIPGYHHYYGWVKDFAETNPESVILTSFATEGDFNITHRLNPVIGTRGPQDMGSVLIWPEYRGDGSVPAWLVDWMATSFPAYRAQGARGFLATDLRPHQREKDLIQGAEFYAFGELTWNGRKTAGQVALEYCRDKFGEQAAPIIAPALRKSSEVIAKTLYLPTGPRFSGHSHIENDLRVMWDVYTLYDSAPFFLTDEQRRDIFQAGPPYQPKIEQALPGLAITSENIGRIIQDKDSAVASASWMIAQVELARPYLNPDIYEQLLTRFEWLMNYARLFRGLARAFFHLRLANPADGMQVIAGAEEMAAAMNMLPQTGLPLPFDIDPQFGGYPWMVTPPGELINSLKAAGELLSNGVLNKPIAVLGCEEAAAAFDSIYLPYERLLDLQANFSGYSAVVVGLALMKELDRHGSNLATYIQEGGKALLYNPTENWECLPVQWLPGQVQSWVCNHPDVMVIQPGHPVLSGYVKLKAEPITRFQATSAQVLEAARSSPFIKSFVVVSNDWTALTHPTALAETIWGKGCLMIDLIPENRTILLRSLAYLTGK